MKMKQREIMKSVMQFARDAGYIDAVLMELKPDEANKRWIAKIDSLKGEKTYVVDDDSGDVSFGSALLE
jgi:hypothetical protein